MAKKLDPVEIAQKELAKVITDKLDTIREKILIGSGPKGGLSKISMLTDINDGLDDVLLEFEINPLDSQFENEAF
jgi:hypothetical protein